MSLREIITNLIDSNMAEIIYYDHSDKPYCPFTNLTNYNPDFYTDHEPCLEFAGSGDYVGSTIDMANRRYVENEYSKLFESGGIIHRNEGYGYTSLIIFFLRPSVARSGLFEDLENLDDYPLIDDQLISDIEQELLEESWDNWGKLEFKSELEKLTGLEFYNTEWQESLFWDILHNGDGSEYFPEGTDVHIDFDEVLSKSDSFIPLIIENCDNLESGEYEITGEYRPTDYELVLGWPYKGQISYEDRMHILELHKGQKINSIPDSILKEFGLRWWQEQKLFWEVKPINKVLKDIVSNGLNSVVMLPYPVKPDCEYEYEFQKHNTCKNCHNDSVCQVNNIDLCPDCYNKLMEYYPKCENCKVKNVNTSLQLYILPDMNTLTHCQDCKNLLLANI